MSKRYFKLSPGVVPGCWALGIPVHPQGQEVEDPWIFTDGAPVPNPGRLRLPFDHPGKPVDFSLAGLGAPVIHAKVASLLTELASTDVQLLPVDIQGQPEQFCILVATRLVRCIDDKASDEVEYWLPEDGRPERVGTYRKVSGMRIDPARVGDAKVFRPWGWSIALIVSEEIKNGLERIGATGTSFKEV
ncbi:imm11 family protein [Archangium sp.]|uniref:imm11 family protein n=1 Tax=Archangium sp. TaxID=1872627 RepID=UPI002ED7E51D